MTRFFHKSPRFHVKHLVLLFVLFSCNLVSAQFVPLLEVHTHLRVEPGGNIFMPDLPSTYEFLPVLIIDPSDGKLYYQDLLPTVTSKNEINHDIQNLRTENQELRNKLDTLINQFEKQAKELEQIKSSLLSSSK